MNLSIDRLKSKFKQPLPGTASHLKMAPPNRAKELLEKQNYLLAARQSAVMILLYPVDNQLRTAFIKRSEYDGITAVKLRFRAAKKKKRIKILKKQRCGKHSKKLGSNPMK